MTNSTTNLQAIDEIPNFQVSINPYIEKQLKKDCRLYKMTLNKLANVVIKNYYNTYTSSNISYMYLKDIINSKLKNYLKELPTDEVITDIVDEIYRSKKHLKGKSGKRTIRINKPNKIILRDIKDNLEEYDKSLIQHIFQHLFISFISLSNNEREEIILADLYEKIENYLKAYKVIIWTNKKKYRMVPYVIADALDDYGKCIYGYDLETKRGHTVTIRSIQKISIDTKIDEPLDAKTLKNSKKFKEKGINLIGDEAIVLLELLINRNKDVKNIISSKIDSETVKEIAANADHLIYDLLKRIKNKDVTFDEEAPKARIITNK